MEETIMKETYEAPIAEIILMNGSDIITDSHQYPGEDDPVD